jgi:hypothetical protein
MRDLLVRILKVVYIYPILDFIRIIKNEKIKQNNITFSQFKEDEKYSDFFNPNEKGSYIDVGSWRPISGSNTFSLYKLGWAGIAIDPSKLNSFLFKIFRKRDRFIRAVASADTRRFLYQFNPSTFNTTDFSTYLMYTKDLRLKYIGKKEFKAIRLSDLDIEMLPENNTLMSIDCEGSDFDVLKSNNWNRITPKVVIVEIHDESLDKISQKEAIFAYLNEVNYIYVYKLHVSYFFVHCSHIKSTSRQ